VDLKVVLFDNHAGPDCRHDLVLGDKLTGTTDQGQQHLNCALPEHDGDAVQQKFAALHNQAEWAESEGRGE